MRQKLYNIVEVTSEKDKIGEIYDAFMLITILISIFPLAIKEQYVVFDRTDRITAAIFVVDYLFRIITADFKLRNGFRSFLYYPFTPMAIIDLISILASVTPLNDSFRLFKVFRLFRIFKVVRYSKNINLIISIFIMKRNALLAVLGLALAYIFVSSMVVFNVEPETFHSYLDAVYWATLSLTSLGYNDVYLVTAAGKAVTVISSFVGIIIVALPAGIISSGLMEKIEKQ